MTVAEMLAVFAQMERDFIVERTVAGLAAAKAQGRTGGRPAKLDAKDVKHARRLIDDGDSIAAVAKRLHVSRATLYRALDAARSTRTITRPLALLGASLVPRRRGAPPNTTEH